jgi:hypothetical protein
MRLGIEQLTEFLDGVVFERDLITDAFIGLDDHQGSDTQLFAFQWSGFKDRAPLASSFDGFG